MTTMMVKVKTPGIRALYGTLIHRPADALPGMSRWNAWARVYQRHHRINVKTVCKNPSFITDPLMLTDKQVIEMLNSDPRIHRCKVCFP